MESKEFSFLTNSSKFETIYWGFGYPLQIRLARVVIHSLLPIVTNQFLNMFHHPSQDALITVISKSWHLCNFFPGEILASDLAHLANSPISPSSRLISTSAFPQHHLQHLHHQSVPRRCHPHVVVIPVLRLTHHFS